VTGRYAIVLLYECCAFADSDVDWYDRVVECYDSAWRRGGEDGADRDSESDGWSMEVQVDLDGE
jgi:hypothetical protein